MEVYELAKTMFDSDKEQLVRIIIEFESNIKSEGTIESRLNDISIYESLMRDIVTVNIKTRELNKINKQKDISIIQCNAYIQSGDRCTRKVTNTDLNKQHYCGLHKKQPYGNVTIGFTKKKID